MLPICVLPVLKNGVLPGIISVAQFMPQIAIIFLFLGFLNTGTNFKKIIPFIVGFGCSTIAVTTTKNKRTIFAVPFIPCGAKLPVFMVIASHFFTFYMVLFLYATSILISFAIAKANNKLEISSSCNLNLYDVFKHFVVRIFTVVAVASAVIYLLSNYNFALHGCNFESSILFYFANFLTPVFTPLGFGTPQAVASIISGLAGKEVIISTLNVLGGISSFTQVSAFSFLVFVLLYTPCISCIVAISSVLGKKMAVLFSVWYFIIAYGVCFIIYNSLVLSLYCGVWFFIFLILTIFVVIITFAFLKKRDIIKNKLNEVKNGKTDCCNCRQTKCGEKRIF
ncbi:MAG: hypothetical protein FWD32_01210 [Firmicutes bacterium]|nr:hypothetical protein [Bacillota bacterium]